MYSFKFSYGFIKNTHIFLVQENIVLLDILQDTTIKDDYPLFALLLQKIKG